MREDRLFEIEYGYWFNMKSERLASRLDFVLNLVQLIGGSAAAMAVLGGWPGGVVAAGLLLALCAAVSLLLQPAVKAERFCVAKRNWLDLKGRASGLDDDALVAAVARLQADGPNGLGALEKPAWNAAVRASGGTQTLKLGAWEALVGAAA